MKKWLTLGLALVFMLILSSGAMAVGNNVVLLGPDENGDYSNYIESGCVLDDTLYIKTENAIYSWKSGDEAPSIFLGTSPKSPNSDSDEETQTEDEQQEPEQPLLLGNYRWLLNLQGKLISLHIETGEFYEFTKDGPVPTGLKLDVMSLEGATGDALDSIYMIDSVVIADDMVFAIARPSSTEWETQILHSVDTTTGALKPLSPNETRILCAAPYKEGQLLLGMDPPRMGTDENDQYVRVRVWDIAKEEFVTDPYILSRAWSINGLCYDAETDYVYLEQNGKVMRTRLDADAELVNYLSRAVYSMTQGYMIDGNLAIIASEGVNVVSLDPALLPTRVLKVAGDWNTDQGIAKFIANNPDVAIDRLDQGFYDIESLVTAYSAGNAPDIFVFDSLNGIHNLFDKGYALDLSGNAELMQMVEQLYPQLQSIVLHNDKLFGYPMNMETGLWAYDAKALEDLGLDYPETLADLIDLLAEWEDEYQEDANGRLLMDPYMMNKEPILYQILSMYIGQYESDDAPLNFDAPQFREPMLALERSSLKAFDSVDEASTVTTTYEWSDSNEPIIDIYAGFWSWRNTNPKTMTMPPKLSKDSEPISIGSASIYVVNPETKEPDLAIDYILTVVENAQADLKYQLTPTLNDPVENRYFEQNVAAYAEYVRSLEEKTVDEADKRQHEAELEIARRDLANTEQWRWDLPAEPIAQYRALAPNIRLMKSMILYNSDASDELMRIIGRYQQKQLDLEQMIRELNQKMQMIYLENQ